MNKDLLDQADQRAYRLVLVYQHLVEDIMEFWGEKANEGQYFKIWSLPQYKLAYEYILNATY